MSDEQIPAVEEVLAEVTDEEWAEYKKKYEKSYANESEDQMRRKIYANAKHRIEKHNEKYAKGEVTWKMAMNHLADLTEDEYSMRRGVKK